MLLVAGAAGALLGRLRAPVGRHAPRVRLDHLWLLAAGVALHLVAAVSAASLSTVALALSLAALVAFAGANRHVTGVVVMGVGLALNLAVLVLNGGMPVRGEALVAAGIVEPDQLAALELDPPRELEDDGSRLAFLGDALPIGGIGQVLSFGDLIILMGFADTAASLSRRRRPAWSDARRESYATRPAMKARPVHDWGAAPSPSPVSATQCSDQPEAAAPATSSSPNAVAAAVVAELVAATHDR